LVGRANEEITQKEVRENGMRLTVRCEDDCQKENGNEKNNKEKIISYVTEGRAEQLAFLPSSFLYSSRYNHKGP
jgi:hypothetical protein